MMSKPGYISHSEHITMAFVLLFVFHKVYYPLTNVDPGLIKKTLSMNLGVLVFPGFSGASSRQGNTSPYF